MNSKRSDDRLTPAPAQTPPENLMKVANLDPVQKQFDPCGADKDSGPDAKDGVDSARLKRPAR